MKKLRIIMLVCIILACAASPLFSQTELGRLQESANSFIDEVATSLPFYSTIGLNWSDAYIGNITDKPPRFGIGFTAGATTMDFGSINSLMSSLNINLPINTERSFFNDVGLPIPAYTAEARIGGFILPFDIGFKVSYVSPSLFDSLFTEESEFDFKHLLIGMDVRYALIHGKTRPFCLSVGAGVNYLDGGISAASSSSMEFSLPGYTVSFASPNIALEWKTITAELKSQISFPLKLFTPYVGAGASYAWSQAGYKVTSSSNLNVPPGAFDIIKELLLNTFNMTGVTEEGFETIKSNHKFNLRAFGGVSANIFVFRIDLTAMYNFLDGNFGATAGLRFQL